MVRARDLIVMVAGLPVAVFALALPHNKYQAWGANGVDCDAPFAVLLFALPSLVLYGAVAIAYGLPLRRTRRLIIAIPCLALCALLVPQVVGALAEQRRNDAASETCR